MDPDLSTGVTQLTYSATIVWLMQQAKNAKWLPWISQHSAVINRGVSIVSSGFVAIGVHWTMEGSLVSGSVITIQIPTLAAIAVGLLHWFQSFVTQETVYQVISNKTPTVEWKAEKTTVIEKDGATKTVTASMGEKVNLAPAEGGSLGPIREPADK